MCGIVVCLSVPVTVRICIGFFIAGCQGYLLASWRTKKQSAYRLAAVLGMIGFLLGMTRMLYAQQQNLAVQNMLQEQNALSGQDALSGREVLSGQDALSGQEVLSGQETLFQQEQKTVIQGKITKKERKNNQTRLYLNHVFLRIGDNTYKTNPVLVQFKEEPSFQSCCIGTTIVLEGNIRQLNHAANDGNYDEYQYYHSQNIDYHFIAEKICSVSGRENIVKEKLFLLKEKLKENYIKYLSERNAGILGTMLLGDKELLERDVTTTFQQAGASHILVISGMHISCIGLFLYKMLRKRGSFLLAGFIAVGTLFLYVEMTGMGISALRAWIMFALLMAAKILGRSYDSRTALAIALLLLLWDNPWLIGYAGLQFSVAAILGVVLVAECIEAVLPAGRSREEEDEKSRKNIHKYWKSIQKYWQKVRKSFAISMAVQLMTLPLVAYYYYEIPIYAVLLNLLIVPLLSVVLINGIAATVLMGVGIWTAKPAIILLEGLLNVIYIGVRWSSQLPGAMKIVGQWSVQKIAAYYLLFACFCLMIKRSKHSWKEEHITAGTHPCIRKRIGVLTGIVLLLVFLHPARNSLFLAMLDVGQGDGIYLRLGKDTTLFVDGGSTDVSKVGQYRILPFLKSNGIAEIDYWLVSHYDEDHVNGLLEILETEYPIKNIVLSGKQPETENYQKICILADQRNIPILYMKAEDEIRSGEDTIRCILPDKQYQAEDENGKSMILRYQTKYISGMFTGDAGVAEEKWLLEQNQIQKVDFLKVGHHGSKNSSSEEFLKALSPEIALISCGENNRYGHPHAETIKRLQMVSAEVYNTVEGGQISFREDRGKVWIQSFR